jgi:hypothetical protein
MSLGRDLRTSSLNGSTDMPDNTSLNMREQQVILVLITLIHWMKLSTTLLLILSRQNQQKKVIKLNCSLLPLVRYSAKKLLKQQLLLPTNHLHTYLSELP